MRQHLVILSVLSLLGPVATQASPAWPPMPQAEVVRRGLDGFLLVSYARLPAGSHPDPVETYAYFERCKRADNNARAQKLSSARRDQIFAVRGALSDAGDASWRLCSLNAGGGPVWRQMAAEADARREEFLGTLLGIMARPTVRSAVARAQARSLLLKVQGDLKYLQSYKNKIEGDGTMSTAQARGAYEENRLQVSAAALRLSRLIAALPDQAALPLARRAYQEIHECVWDGNW